MKPQRIPASHATSSLVVLVLTLGATACSPAAMQAFSEGVADVAAAKAASTKLMVFGGPGHDTYLGCLTCSANSSDSVLNEYSSYGNPYSSTSLFNSYSQFGSPYSDYSACNPMASDPPVVVDDDGTFYGRLTVNTYHPQALRSEETVTWLEHSVCP